MTDDLFGAKEIIYGGGAFSLISAVLTYLVRRWIDARYERDRAVDEAERKGRQDAEAAVLTERAGVVSGFSSLVRSLQAQVDESKRDRINLWRMLQDVQQDLQECQRLHREDEARITVMKVEYESKIGELHAERNALTHRVRILEERLPPT